MTTSVVIVSGLNTQIQIRSLVSCCLDSQFSKTDSGIKAFTVNKAVLCTVLTTFSTVAANRIFSVTTCFLAAFCYIQVFGSMPDSTLEQVSSISTHKHGYMSMWGHWHWPPQLYKKSINLTLFTNHLFLIWKILILPKPYGKRFM